jgi:hypothetical protein
MSRFTLGTLLAAAGLAAVLSGSSAVAGEPASRAEVEALRHQLASQQQRMDTLEDLLRGTIAKDIAALRHEVDAVGERADATPFASWAEKIKFKGDFRYRHEWIDDENKSRSRARQRIRVRLGLEAHPTEDLDFYLRMASGSDDPVSANQTLDGAFSTKGWHLDRAYIDWHPDALQGVHILAGKMGLAPVYRPMKSSLIFDGDLSLEGLALAYSTNLAETTKIFMNCGFFWIDENSSAEDVSLLACQLGLTQQLTETTKFTIGGGYYDYHNLDVGDTVIVDPEDSFGNSSTTVTDTDTLDCTAGGAPVICTTEREVYDSEFRICEAFCLLETKAGDLPFYGYGHYAHNTAADSGKDTGWLVGCQLGKAKKPGSWQIAYNYRSLEDDAVVGALTDSDFNGGGTGGEGHVIGCAYQVNKAAQIACTYILSNDVDDSGGDDSYRRLQLDFKVKF